MGQILEFMRKKADIQNGFVLLLQKGKVLHGKNFPVKTGWLIQPKRIF